MCNYSISILSKESWRGKTTEKCIEQAKYNQSNQMKTGKTDTHME